MKQANAAFPIRDISEDPKGDDGMCYLRQSNIYTFYFFPYNLSRVETRNQVCEGVSKDDSIARIGWGQCLLLYEKSNPHVSHALAQDPNAMGPC